jgi:hypothetical protein
MCGLLQTSATGTQDAPHMGRVVPHPKLLFDHVRDPCPCPHRAPKAVCLDPLNQQLRQASPLISTQAWRRALLAPHRGLSPPSSWACLNHWLTAPGVTSNSSAILFYSQPCCLISQARKRRGKRRDQEGVYYTIAAKCKMRPRGD